MKIINLIEELVNIPSPTGYTHKLEKWLVEKIEEIGYEPETSEKGNIHFCLNPEVKGEGLLLSAHIDTLGMMVRFIKPNGRLRAATIGGFPFNYVEQENLVVHTRDGKEITGTFRLNDPAVHASKEIATAERTDENMEIVLDIVSNSKEDTEKAGISAGDFVSLDPRFAYSNGFVKSRHLDDKACVALLLVLAEKVKEENIQFNRPIHLLFTNFEEVGHGASAGHPEGITDMIAIDMGVIGNEINGDETKISICAQDATGPYDYHLTNRLVKAADEIGVDYDLDIFPYYGSDASAARTAGHDYRTALMGPGIAASHGYERTHEIALDASLQLLLQILRDE